MNNNLNDILKNLDISNEETSRKYLNQLLQCFADEDIKKQEDYINQSFELLSTIFTESVLLSFHQKCITEELAAMLLCSRLIVATEVWADFEVESEHGDIFLGEVLSLQLLSGGSCTMLVLAREIDKLQAEGAI